MDGVLICVSVCPSITAYSFDRNALALADMADRWYFEALSMLRQFVMNGALMLHQNSIAAHILLSILVSAVYIVTVVKLQP